MKTIIALALLATSVAATAQPDNNSDAARFQKEMAVAGINYVWMRDIDNTVSIYVFDDTATTPICDMGEKYPDVTLVKVVNYSNKNSTGCIVK